MSLNEQNTPGPSARELPLPNTLFYSIEYPGYVRPTSVPQVVRMLGGQTSINTAFRRTASKNDALLELNLRPDNPFSHPIPGDITATSNIVLKVVKRKRKPGSSSPEGLVGEYTAEAIGVIPKTARFRSMIDYQFQPDMNDPIAKLRKSMAVMDVDGIRAYRIPEADENYTSPRPALQIDPELTGVPQEQSTATSNLRLFPPPLFSRQTIPQNYNYKANPVSVVATSVDEETGEEKKRLINKMRWKGYGPTSIMFTEKEVPKKPPANVEEVRNQYDQGLIKKLEELFEARPIWTRAALLNQFTHAQARDIVNSKVLLPLTCYVFQDGPWRDTMVRFSYDPRIKPEARVYQRLYFRNLNHPMARPSVVTRRQESRYSVTSQSRSAVDREREERSRSHIFDGQTVTTETAAFQLCDITDPMLKGMIEDEESVRDTCNERDGWYSTHALERIKVVLRHKFFSLLDGHVATDEECEKILAQEGVVTATQPSMRKLRPGRHNMAKGALRPEDAAAVRLRAALQKDRASRAS
ncbi:hypothetical protein EVG20_g894 [Dentipellis fragilis]|uniref:Transcription factor IIIC subunit 5 HTH domain-containing protein n=1 Tax=Dentipellis fragilis TaxID=205917 RepID=A0A4Y9ZE00_9AGAM|nr:hypothetical protein EVG20_g894 [Dentipellis fragilis]